MKTLPRIASILITVAACSCSSADFDTAALTSDDDSGDAGVETSSSLDTGASSSDTRPATDSGAHDDTSSSPDTSPAADTGTIVDSGSIADSGTVLDSIAVDTPTSSSASFLMPKSSDTRHLVEDPYMGLAGDYIEGTRSTSLASATRFSGSFDFENDLSGGSLSIDVYINGTKVGSIGPITASPKTAGPLSFDFSFAAIAGPSFDVKYVANPAVDRLGTIGVHFDATTVRLDS